MKLVLNITLLFLFFLSNCNSNKTEYQKMNKKKKEEAHNSLFKLIHYPEDEAIEFTKKLIEKGVPVDIKNSSGFPATHVAMVRHCPKTVMYLLEKGANVNVKDCDSATLLHYAAAGGYPTIVKYLIDKGADLDAKAVNNLTPLLFTTGIFIYSDPDSVKLIMQYLLDAGADINALDSDSNTALLRAVLSDESHYDIPEKVGYEIPQIMDNGNLTYDQRHKTYSGSFRSLRGLPTSSKSETIRILGTCEYNVPASFMLNILKPLIKKGANPKQANKYGINAKKFVEEKYKKEREQEGERCKLLDENPIKFYYYYAAVELFNGNLDIEPLKE